MATGRKKQKEKLLLTSVSAIYFTDDIIIISKIFLRLEFRGHFLFPHPTKSRVLFALFLFFFSLLFFHYFAFENVDFHIFFNIFYMIPLHFLQGINLLYHLSFFGVSVISSLIKLQNFNKKKLDLIKKILNLITVFKSVFSCKSWNRSNYNSRLINSCDRS